MDKYIEGRKTIFLDIDGCIIEHPGNFLHIISRVHDNALLPGVLEMFTKWEAEGSCIVLTTGRKECMRALTEQQLRSYGLFWDMLIMGINNGPRLLINDRKPDGRTTAFAINLTRNTGLSDILQQ
jgi:hypothetical protein